MTPYATLAKAVEENVSQYCGLRGEGSERRTHSIRSCSEELATSATPREGFQR
jgi:hypothetical protein